MEAAPPLEFWATSAQTLPILALAVVVEARAIAANWIPGEHRWLKRIQVLLWGMSLGFSAIAENVCFNALAGQRVWAGWEFLIRSVVSFSLSILVLNPALEFVVRGYAGPVARLWTWFVTMPLSVRLQVFRLVTIRRFGREFRKLAEVELKLDEMEHELSGAEDEVMRMAGEEGVDPADVLARLERARHGIRLLRGRVNSLKDSLYQASAGNLEHLSRLRALRKEMAQAAEMHIEQWSFTDSPLAREDLGVDDEPH